MKILFSSLFFLAFVSLGLAQESHLLVSTGGGIAGTATVYKIAMNGKVQKGKGLGDIVYTEASKLKKCKVKKYVKKSRTLMTTNPDFNHPGNIYYSITLSESGQEKKITWGDAAHETPEEAKKLYQKINTALTRLSFTPETGK